MDAPTERAIVEVLDGLAAQGKTIVVVHHDLQTCLARSLRCLLVGNSFLHPDNFRPDLDRLFDHRWHVFGTAENLHHIDLFRDG